MIRTATAALAMLLAFSALAQSASEFGRASGGEIDVLTKQGRKLSGSLGFMQSSAARGQGYEMTAGGTILDDRIWFFGSASRTFQPASAKIDAQPIDWNHITASFTKTDATPLTLPSSFLNLHSTTMFSPSSMMSISISRQSVR